MRSESLAKIDDFSGRKMRSGEFPERFSHFLFPIETRVRSRKFYCIREARFDKSTRRERESNFSIKMTTRLNLIFLYPNSIVMRTTDFRISGQIHLRLNFFFPLEYFKVIQPHNFPTRLFGMILERIRFLNK